MSETTLVDSISAILGVLEARLLDQLSAIREERRTVSKDVRLLLENSRLASIVDNREFNSPREDSDARHSVRSRLQDSYDDCKSSKYRTQIFSVSPFDLFASR